MPKIQMQKPLHPLKYRMLAPFSERYKTKAKIAASAMPLQTIVPHIVMSDDRKLLFVQNSKAGCTSASHLIYEYSRGNRYEGKIHARDAGLHRGLSYFDDALIALNSPETYVFSIVRDPLKRAVSCFKNFFIDQKNRNYPKYSRSIRKLGFVDGGPMEDNFDSFLRLIELSFTQNLVLTDPHFRLQTLNLGYPDIRYDRICKLENYNADMQAVFKDIGFMFPRDSGALRKRENASKPSQFSPSAMQVKKIEALYAKDYEAFGY